jgi:tryptophan synthase alpha chain
MGYANPSLAHGVERFVREAAAAGVDGLIVPDLPPDEPEAEELAALCDHHGIAPIYLLAPTSTADRIDLAVSRSKGFVYLVSVTGITGARAALPADLADFVHRVRAVADRKPPGERPYLAIGFGIGTPEQSAQVAQIADGVIVGSALVRLAAGSADPVHDVAALGRALAEAAKTAEPV